LSLPSISIDKLTEALTPPGTNAGYDYETLETVGDSVLKLGTSVHLLITHPTLDEGRLSDLRHNSICNTFLMKKALAIGLNHWVLPEPFRVTNWLPSEVNDGGYQSRAGSPESGLTTTSGISDGSIEIGIGKKSLADSMEAILGAALLTGGIDFAVTTGSKLGLCFGGEIPWGRESTPVITSRNGFLILLWP
jgi:endoribonuclease Dicer